MKKFILALALVFTAPAWSMLVSERTVLKHWNIDAQSPLNEREVIASSLFINHQAQTIALTVTFPWFCPAGAACATVMPELSFDFTIESVVYNRCGIRQITAKSGLNVLQIVDSSTSHCPALTSNDPIVVDLFLNDGDGFSHDQFFGESFQSSFDFGMVEGNGSNARKLEIDQTQVIKVRPVSALR